MITTTYGMEKPESGDAGNVFCPGLERNIDRFIAHIHDGSTSAAISAKNITKGTASTGSWIEDVGNDEYYMELDLPAGYAFDTTIIDITVSDGRKYDGAIKKVDSDTFRVYSNVNTLSLSFVYG